jgi:hypothetical protein
MFIISISVYSPNQLASCKPKELKHIVDEEYNEEHTNISVHQASPYAEETGGYLIKWTTLSTAIPQTHLKCLFNVFVQALLSVGT